jgi:hypothetical protein
MFARKGSFEVVTLHTRPVPSVQQPIYVQGLAAAE